ncbi:hypothetical protein Tco_0308034 [Tanacetum coccineum]
MSSPEHISPLPAISPFLCTDSSEALDSSDGPPSQDPYVITVARWRSKLVISMRHASPHSSDHHPSSSSSYSNSSPVYSSGLDAPDQAPSGYLTRDVSPRLGYPREAPHVSGDLTDRPLHYRHSLLTITRRDVTPVDYVPLIYASYRINSSYPLSLHLVRGSEIHIPEASLEEIPRFDPYKTEVE